MYHTLVPLQDTSAHTTGNIEMSLGEYLEETLESQGGLYTPLTPEVRG